MIQPISRPPSALSYIAASRYAAGMLDSRLFGSPEPAFPEDYTGRLLRAGEMALFCAIRPKITQKKTSCFC